MLYVVCSSVPVFSILSVHIPKPLTASHSTPSCHPPYPLLPPTLWLAARTPLLPPTIELAASHPTPSCHPSYPLLPPILPPPARHPMTCVRTPPPATIPSLDINSCQIYYIYLWACGCTPSIADNYSYIATCILHSTFTLNFSNKHKLFHVFCSVMEYSCKSRHFLCISMLVLQVLCTSLTLIKSA